MTTDQPEDLGRWPLDSPEEDAALLQAQESAELDRWARTRRLQERLPVEISNRGATYRIEVPDWWHSVQRPVPACGICEHRMSRDPRRRFRWAGRGQICGACRGEQARLCPGAEERLLAYWDGMPAERRRLWIALTHGIDPWSGRRAEFTEIWIDPEEGVTVTPRLAIPTLVPRCYWDTWREHGGELTR